MKKVVVLGGGMGGLSAAYELAERGFAVEVYEKLDIYGGKARSFGVPGSAGEGPPLPAEHGFRVFPCWYRHVNDTLSRIPYTGRGATPGMTVDQRLVEVPFLAYAMEDGPPFAFPTGEFDHLHELVALLHAIFTHDRLGVPRHDAEYFVRQMVSFMGSSDIRRRHVHEHTSWWDYLQAAQRSAAYRRVCATGMTRSLVAMRAEVSSTYTVALILAQMLFAILEGREPNRVLDGPTSEIWIDPWVRQMRDDMGVAFRGGATVRGLTMANGRVQSAEIETCEGVETVSGDHFVLALPVEVTRALLTPDQLAAAGIERIAHLETSWMNGIMFYMKKPVALTEGHVIYLDAPWALTSISQAQFWKPEFRPESYGDGTVRDILSTIVSEWGEPGDQGFDKPAREAPDAETLVEEVWRQLKASRADAGKGALEDADRAAWFLDPAISGFGATLTNAEPLLINTVGSIANRPEARTGIANLALAGDYVNTYTNLATMEGANEAGRRAANAVLEAEGFAGAKAGVWPLSEPAIFDPWKWLDRHTFDPTRPGEPPIAWTVDHLLGFMGSVDRGLSVRSSAVAATEARRNARTEHAPFDFGTAP